VNAELRVLEAEGNALKEPERTESTSGNGTGGLSGQPATISNPKGPGRKRGPKPDYETAAHVAEIVARVAPDEDWRSKREEICEELDDAQIPIPSKWRREVPPCRSWSEQLDRQKLLKVISYRCQQAITSGWSKK